MKQRNYLIVALAAIAGCSDGDPSSTRKSSAELIVSTDLQDDLWHAHRHMHDNVQLHDHGHTPAFTGGHEHPHGHTHRHAETPMGGIVVSLERRATYGQLPGDGIVVPPRLHLEILPGLPTELNLCLLSEVVLPQPSITDKSMPALIETETDRKKEKEELDQKGLVGASSPDTVETWSYWTPDLPTITISFKLEGTEYALVCEKLKKSAAAPEINDKNLFSSTLPASLRDRLASTKARLRVAKLAIAIGDAHFRIREQIYFQGEELFVFLQ